MPVTFTNWNACDWQGGYTLDWSSEAALNGRLLFPYCEALRQAIQERSELTGTGVSALLDDPLDDLTLPTAAWFSAAGNAAHTLMYDFMNHNTDGGSWHGLDHFALNWDEADMLAQLGDASFLDLAVLQQPQAAWFFQKHSMLDQMRWTRRDTAAAHAGGGGAVELARVGQGGSRAAAEADYQQADAFFAGPWGAYVYNSGGDWTINRHYGEAAFSGYTTALSYDVDFYVYITRYDALGISVGWHDELGVGENKWYIQESFSNPDQPVHQLIEWNNAAMPDFAENTGWMARDNNDDFRSICKFDVAGGFTFVT